MEIPLGADDGLDLAKLEEAVSDPAYSRRFKIGSFSATSNVTGLKTDVYEVAKILHRHGAIACFDFAACAPYLEIDMNKDAESYFDAIFLSPHKFLGGPGTRGILVINKNIYPANLPPQWLEAERLNSSQKAGTIISRTSKQEKRQAPRESSRTCGRGWHFS